MGWNSLLAILAGFGASGGMVPVPPTPPPAKVTAADRFAAAALLNLPADADDPLPDAATFPGLSKAIQELAVAREILDPRECRYVLFNRDCYRADLEAVRMRNTEFRDYPPLADHLRFPARDRVNEFVRFNRAFRKHVEGRMALERDRAAFYEEVLRETDALYAFWDAVRDARCEFYYVTVRRRALQKLRLLLGEENYNADRRPPPACSACLAFQQPGVVMLRRSFLSWLGLAPAAAVSETLSPPKSAELAVPLAAAELKRPKVLRLWKLGSLEHRVFSSDELAKNLADKLAGWDGESDFDLIWGPDIDVQCVAVGDGTDLVAGPNVRLVRVDEKTIRVEVLKDSGRDALSFFTRHALEPGQSPEFPLELVRAEQQPYVSFANPYELIWLRPREGWVRIPTNLSRDTLSQKAEDLLFHTAGLPKNGKTLPRLDVSNTITVRGRLLLVADREKLVLVEKDDKFGLAVLSSDAVWFADE